MEVLLTGFEPFDGARVNPSMEVLHELSGEMETLLLPVEAYRAARLLEERLSPPFPEVLLMLGEARESAAVQVERFAHNLMDFEIPDAAGVLHRERPVVEEGPLCYAATLPPRPVRDAIRQAGIPAVLSTGAGAYLCNLAFYLALHRVARAGATTRVGFLHLPSLPEQVAGERHPGPTMGLAEQVRAVRAALAGGRTRRPGGEDPRAGPGKEPSATPSNPGG